MDLASATGVAIAVGTFALTVMAYLFSRRAARQAARRVIGDLANSLAMMRVDWPHVMRVPRTWTAECWPVTYGAVPRADADDLARYYAYVDVGLEFCNSVLAAARDRHITRDALADHYGPLVKLFLTENWPIIDDMLGHDYIARTIRAEIDRLQKVDGWDFSERFAALVS